MLWQSGQITENRLLFCCVCFGDCLPALLNAEGQGDAVLAEFETFRYRAVTAAFQLLPWPAQLHAVAGMGVRI